jgi:AraC family transcriptional regulator
MPAVLLNPDALALGTSPALLRGTGFRYDVRDFPGPLSVKTVSRGRARWKTEDGEFWVDETSLLVVNERQPYSITVDSRDKVETCCLFFERGSVESVHRALTEAPEQLVDDPFCATPELRFRVRLQFGDDKLMPRLKAMDRAVRCGALDQSWLENQVMLAARDLLAIEERTEREIARVPAARPATREEIFKRVCRAREFLYASQDQAVRLEDASRAACLSPYHLHRAFRQAFGETPHNFLTRVRLDRARRLLSTTQLTITEVCLGCGFESPGSFSTLFRKKFGRSPREFRRAATNR